MLVEVGAGRRIAGAARGVASLLPALEPRLHVCKSLGLAHPRVGGARAHAKEGVVLGQRLLMHLLLHARALLDVLLVLVVEQRQIGEAVLIDPVRVDDRLHLVHFAAPLCRLAAGCTAARRRVEND